jgi:Tol biopolymer transport system component
MPVSFDGAYSIVHNVSASPDGSRVAYTVTFSEDHKEISEIWVMQIGDGSKQRVRQVEGIIHALSWSPATDQLIYSYQPGAMPAFRDPSELWVLNSDGTGAKFLADNHGECYPVWSPDGRYVAFVRVDDLELFLSDWRGPGTNVYIVDTVTGGATRLSAFEGRGNTFPTWSPDSKFVAFLSSVITGDPEFSTSPTSAQVWVASADGAQIYLVSDTARYGSALLWLPPVSGDTR